MVMIGLATCDDTPVAQHVAAVTLRDQLLSVCHMDAAAVERLPSGRPILQVPGADLSIAHSGGAVMVGVSVDREIDTAVAIDGVTVWSRPETAVRIGVDIEEIPSASRAPRLRELAARYFTTAESEQLAGLDDEHFVQTFCRLWTVKESICKMTGEGLSALRRTDTASLPSGVTVHTDTITIAGRTYYASVCIE